MSARTHAKCSTAWIAFDAFDTRQTTEFGWFQAANPNHIMQKWNNHTRITNMWRTGVKKTTNLRKNGNKQLRFPNIFQSVPFIDSFSQPVDSLIHWNDNNCSTHTRNCIEHNGTQPLEFECVCQTRTKQLKFLHTNVDCSIVCCCYLFSKILVMKLRRMNISCDVFSSHNVWHGRSSTGTSGDCKWYES